MCQCNSCNNNSRERCGCNNGRNGCGCGCNNGRSGCGCGCNNGRNGCGCFSCLCDSISDALGNLFADGCGCNRGCGCGCCCNNCRRNNGCCHNGSSLNLSSATQCGNDGDWYYERQYALFNTQNGCHSCGCHREHTTCGCN